MAAKKKNNALKRQLYGTPLPLPCLQQQPHSSHDQQQPPTAAYTPSAVAAAGAKTCTPLDSLLQRIMHLYYAWIGSEHCILYSGGPPESNLIHAEFHPQGECVWVKSGKDMETLFRQGFFGKGTLSRSEATWKQRNTGDVSGMSLEEITRQRRIERARLRNEKLQQQQGQSLASSTAGPSAPASASASALSSNSPGTLLSSSELDRSLTPVSASPPPDIQQTSSRSGTPADSLNEIRNVAPSKAEEEANYEHLQLSLEEAFFLVFAVECLAISDASATPSTPPDTTTAKAMTIQGCWLRFSKAAALSIKPTPKLLSSQCSPHINLKSNNDTVISVDNPFVIRYVAYHYYRSLGWIVKDGLKYGADFLLYQKGMVFGHSQYAVRVVPSADYDNKDLDSDLTAPSQEGRSVNFMKYPMTRPGFSPTPGLCLAHTSLSWQWLLTLNRVIAQTVILCHVILPTSATMRQLSHPRTALPLYKVAEIGVKRFIPEKNRA
ncbi:tRNA splicing endonuclease subunit sen2 [Gamsiella multidivaricata]|nr:tRNA splicing endonuclease subunit sen2 [Gamsiella multidivaricata]